MKKSATLAALLANLLAAQLAAQAGEPKFSEVYGCGRAVCVDTVFPLGEEIGILDLETGQYSKARVIRHIRFENEVNSFPALALDAPIALSMERGKYVAFDIDSENHAVFDVTYATCNLAELHLPDSVITAALTRDVGCLTYETEGLDAGFCRRAPLKGVDLYKTHVTGLANGPQFIAIEGAYKVLNAPCSLGNEHAFTLNGQLYVFAGSGGCECGAQGVELYRIDKDGPVLVYASWKWSN